jgi:hypothetical protein
MLHDTFSRKTHNTFFPALGTGCWDFKLGISRLLFK